MIYCYYDKYGVLREIINDTSIRQGTSSNNAKIYVYLEDYLDIGVNSMSVIYQSSNFKSLTYQNTGVIDGVVPYNKNINYKFFKDNTPYHFYIFEIPSEVLDLGGDANRPTNVSASITAQLTPFDETEQSNDIALGLLTFNLQGRALNTDNLITLSQFEYLLGLLGQTRYFEQNGIIGVLKSEENITNNQRVDNTNRKDGLFVLQVGDENFDLFRIINRRYVLVYSTQAIVDLFNQWLEAQPIAIYITPVEDSESDEMLVIETANALFTGDY